MSIDIKHLLQSHSLKITPGRISILECFSREHKPLNAEDIAKKLKNKKIDQATIYRTLENFEKKGILKRIDLRKDSVFYELAHDHHHHMVCTSCGIIEDFEACSVEKMLSSVVAQSKKFNLINDHSLELFGVCRVCQKQ